MAYITCPICTGRKYNIGMGMIEHKCENCKAVGYIEEEPIKLTVTKDIPLPIKLVVEQKNKPMIPKKWGRASRKVKETQGEIKIEL